MSFNPKTDDEFKYRGAPDLIHVPDGRRAEFAGWLAKQLSSRMRAQARVNGKSYWDSATQFLCAGCYMVVGFDLLVTLARWNNQPINELCDSMIDAFTKLKAHGQLETTEEIQVILDPCEESNA